MADSAHYGFGKKFYDPSYTLIIQLEQHFQSTLITRTRPFN